MDNTFDEFVARFENWTNVSLSMSNHQNRSLFLTDLHKDQTHIFSTQATETIHSLAYVLGLSLLLTVIIFSTIVGNVFVLVAILKERNLQTVSNYLVFSLAIADLMVACLIMPIAAQYEVMDQEWVLGPVLCEMWTSADVLCCTASILHLVAIAIDRYRGVTDVNYIQQRNVRKVCLMIVFIWSVGIFVTLGPLLGWKDEKFLYRIEKEKRCLVSQDVGYQIFATCASFYVPLVVILILYWRIYQMVRKRIRGRPGIHPVALLPLVCSENVLDLTSANDSSRTCSSSRQKKHLELKREKRAAKTLAIITGVFVVCWLPFFVMVLVMALRPDLNPYPWIFSLFLWLGYMNSTLNPLIYTLFSSDFRKAFSRMVWGRNGTNRARKIGCLYSTDSVF